MYSANRLKQFSLMKMAGRTVLLSVLLFLLQGEFITKVPICGIHKRNETVNYATKRLTQKKKMRKATRR